MRGQPSRFSRASSLLRGAAVVGVMTTVVAFGGVGAAFAVDPTPTTGASGGSTNSNLGPKTAGTAVCTLTSSTLTQISGMVTTANGYLVVEARDENQLRLYSLDANCKATPKTYTNANPLSPEDLQVDTDGTIWVGDIGDPDGNRPTIAIHKIAPNTSAAVPNRMVYTDGAKDASAFLIDGDSLPVILANVSGKAGVALYKPTKALVPNSTVIANLPTLEKKGEFTPEQTGTSNPTSESLVTGAAKSKDGKKVVIRTLADAYEWDVPDGDVVKAITTTKPRITPLPDEPQGEAIAYTADGKFVTVGFKTASATENAKILSYAPFVPTQAADPGDGGGAPTTPPAEQSWLSKLSFSQLTRIVAAVGVVGLVLAIAGIVGIRRARKRRREEEDEYDEYDDDYDDRPRRGRGGPPGRERGYGPRDPQYDDQYGGGYAEAGYGANGYPPANGYGANGYADPGYGQPAAANGYGQQHDQYGADPYGQQYEGQYGADQYAGQPGYDGYGQQQYGADQYGGDQYGGQGQYGADPYGGAPAAPQQYGDYGGQGQYGGYGYDEFDPTHDPRRR